MVNSRVKPCMALAIMVGLDSIDFKTIILFLLESTFPFFLTFFFHAWDSPQSLFFFFFFFFSVSHLFKSMNFVLKPSDAYVGQGVCGACMWYLPQPVNCGLRYQTLHLESGVVLLQLDARWNVCNGLW